MPKVKEVRMLSPDGEFGYVPDKELHAALKEGFQLAPQAAGPKLPEPSGKDRFLTAVGAKFPTLGEALKGTVPEMVQGSDQGGAEEFWKAVAEGKPREETLDLFTGKVVPKGQTTGASDLVPEWLKRMMGSNTTTADPIGGAGELVGATLQSAPAIAQGLNAIPRKGRASRNIEAAKQRVGSQPIGTSQIEPVAQELEAVAHRGGVQTPQVIKNLLADIENGPITFADSLDRTTGLGGKLAKAEADVMNRPMQKVMERHMAKVYKALRESQRATASLGGVEKQFQSGIREYGQAARAAEVRRALIELGKKAAVTGAVGGIGYGAYKAFD